MSSKNKQHDPFFRIKSTKRSNAEARTTLDTLHTVQIEKMYANEKELNDIIDEKNILEKSIQSGTITDDIIYEKCESKLKVLEAEISSRINKNEFLDYF